MGAWTSFYDSFLTSGSYEHLTSNSMISIPWIVIGLFVGIAVAFVATVFTKRVLGELPRKLLSENVLCPEEAKTLSELSLGKSFFLRWAVKGNVSLRRVVRCREEDEYWQTLEGEASEHESDEKRSRKERRKERKRREKPFRVDPDRHHFYLPSECQEMARVKFNQKGTSLGMLFLLLGVLLIALIVILLALPRLMGLLDDFVGTMKNAASSGNDKILS